MSDRKRTFPVKRLATDAVLIAVYFALAVLSVEIAGVKITFNSLPVVLAAMVFGPVDGFLVPFLGEFLSQMLRYGLTPTTVLWMLAPALRGLIVGFAVRGLKGSMSVDTLLGEKRPWVYFVVCALAAVVTSLGNTGAYYADLRRGRGPDRVQRGLLAADRGPRHPGPRRPAPGAPHHGRQGRARRPRLTAAKTGP